MPRHSSTCLATAAHASPQQRMPRHSSACLATAAHASPQQHMPRHSSTSLATAAHACACMSVVRGWWGRLWRAWRAHVEFDGKLINKDGGKGRAVGASRVTRKRREESRAPNARPHAARHRLVRHRRPVGCGGRGRCGGLLGGGCGGFGREGLGGDPASSVVDVFGLLGRECARGVCGWSRLGEVDLAAAQRAIDAVPTVVALAVAVYTRAAPVALVQAHHEHRRRTAANPPYITSIQHVNNREARTSTVTSKPRRGEHARAHARVGSLATGWLQGGPRVAPGSLATGARCGQAERPAGRGWGPGAGGGWPGCVGGGE
jgi:hypothetical protein